MRILFCDIDHVLADAFWRDHLIDPDHQKNSEDTFNYYHRKSFGDRAIESSVSIVNALSGSGYAICMLTARPEHFRTSTETWLKRHNIKFTAVAMRPTGDRRPSPQLKVESAAYILNNIRRSGEPIEDIIVMDDRDDVVQAFRNFGVTTIRFDYNKSKADEKAQRNYNAKEEDFQEFKQVTSDNREYHIRRA